MEENINTNNPLGTEDERTLLRRFAIPSIIAMLVGALYNIVDQFFIGQAIGELGNAATNIAFPLTTANISIALLLGIGSASAFNLAMGQGHPEKAKHFIGNAVTLCFLGGLILMAIVLLFTEPLLYFFGSPKEVLPYADEYVRITAIGFPAMIMSAAGAHIVRADGSPKITMVINIIGAVVNTVLDATFVFGLNMGMKGAALATIIGQYVATAIVVFYLPRFKTVKLTKDVFIPKGETVLRIVTLGTGPFLNQISFLVVQVVLNNSLRHYGGMSEFGESIPIAVSGIGMKVFQLAGSFVIGISQGLQPIASFNYGAKNYSRVKRAYLLATRAALILCIFFFIIFEAFAREILSIFGEGSSSYFSFGVPFFRIFNFGILFFFMQPVASNFFTSIGKPQKGIFLSLTRQIIFFIPLLLILPVFFGINGITITAPIADTISFLVCLLLIIREFNKPEFKEKSL